MKVLKYIKDNWNNLPKSNFNNDEVVIFNEIQNYDGGWGHHTYEGYGANINGNLIWCYSSGCSCSGDSYTEGPKDVKTFQVDNPNLTDLNPESIDWNGLQVEFNNY